MMTREQHSRLLDLIKVRHAQDPNLAQLLEDAEEYYEAANDAEDDLADMTDEVRYVDFIIYLDMR